MSLPVEIWQLIADRLWSPDRARLCLAVRALYALELVFIRAFRRRIPVHAGVRKIIYRMSKWLYRGRLISGYSARMMSRTYVLYILYSAQFANPAERLEAYCTDHGRNFTIYHRRTTVQVIMDPNGTHVSYIHLDNYLRHSQTTMRDVVYQRLVRSGRDLTCAEKCRLLIALGKFYYYLPIDEYSCTYADKWRAKNRVTRQL